MLTEEDTLSLVKEKSVNYKTDNPYLTKPEEIVKMLNSVYDLGSQSEEYLYLLCFNSKMKPIGVLEVSHGAVAYSIADPREIFIKALMCNASHIILAHNHPSQNVEASKNDLCVYNRIKECSELLGIGFLDFLIVARNKYCSFKEELKNQ